MTENSNTPQIELWQDVNRKLDKKRLENSLALSLPKFIEAYGSNMSSKDLDAFNTAVKDVIDNIQNGNVNERTAARELVFKDGKERGTENKRIKQAYGLAVNFVNSVIDAMPEYIEPIKQPIQKVEIPQQANTQESVQQAVQQPVQAQESNNPIDIVNSKIQKVQQNKQNELLNRIKNWNIEGPSISIQLPNTNYTEDAVITQYKKMKLGKGYANLFRNKIAPEFFKNLNNILSPEKLNVRDAQITNQFGHTMSAKQHIANTLDFFIKHPDLVPNNGEFNALQSGEVTIPGSFNENTGTILLYDPSNKTLSRKSITQNPELWNHFQYTHGLAQPPQQQQDDNFVPTDKNGGKLEQVRKFEYGGTALYALQQRDYMTDDQLNQYINNFQTVQDRINQAKEDKLLNAKQQKIKSVQDAAAAKGRSFETQQKMGTSFKNKQELSNADIARLVAATGDLAAVGTSFIPAYGQVASGILGVGSTLTNLGADIADGENLGNALSTAGINLGLDTMGLIPGVGASGKVGKVAKTLTKFAPWIIASMSVANLGEEVKSFKKLVTDPTSVSADDLRNVASGLSVVLGIKQGLKGRSIRNKALDADKIAIRTTSGKVAVLNKAEIENLKGNKALQEKINAIPGFENETVKGAFSPEENNWKNAWGRLTSKPETINVYDFTKLKGYGNKYSDPNIYEKLTYGYKQKPSVTTSPNNIQYKDLVPNSPLKSSIARQQEPTAAEVAMNNFATSMRNKRLAQMRRTNVPGPFKPNPYQKGDYKRMYPESAYGFKFKEGGIVKAQQGKVLQYGYNTGVTFGKNTTWLNNVFNNYRQHILDQLSPTDDNYGNWLNDMQHRHSGLYNAANDSGDWSKTAYWDKTNAVKTYQDDYAGRNDKLLDKYDYNVNGIAHAVKANRYDLYGTRKRTSQDWGSGNWKSDNLYSSITDDRRLLGRKGDWDENSNTYKNFQSDLAKKNYTMYLDPNDGYYKIKRLNQPQQPINQDGYKIGEGQLPDNKSILGQLNDAVNSPEMKAELSALGRLYWTNMANNRRLKKMNDFYPLKEIAPQYQRQTTDLISQIKAVQDQNAQRSSQAQLPKYADASLNEAIARDTARTNAEASQQVNLQNDQYHREQRAQNDQLAATNIDKRVGNINANTMHQFEADQIKKANEMKISAQNDLNTSKYLAAEEMRLRQKAQKAEDLQDFWKQRQLGTIDEEYQTLVNNDPQYRNVRNQIMQLGAQGVGASDPRMVSLQQQQNDIISRLQNQAKNNMYTKMEKLWGLKRIPGISTPPYKAIIASGANGMSIKIKTNSSYQMEKNKLRARSKDLDRFSKQLNKTVDSFLSQNKALGKSMLDKITIINK